MPSIQVGGHRGGARKVEAMYAEIDDEDVERVSQYDWSINDTSNPNTQYAQTCPSGHKIHLHRFIMGLGDYKDDKRVINHIDGNGLNNKKINLEICDNLYNSQSFRRPNSNIGNVYFDTSMKRVKRWTAQITIDKVKMRKRFLTEGECRPWIDEQVATHLIKK